MISVVCVYNNREALDRILLPSLRKQTNHPNNSPPNQTILLDNTEKKFRSAAEASNFGAKQATGKYIMFVHQDIELMSSTWLADTEKMLEKIPDLGIAGVIGKSNKGKTVGWICDRGLDFGTPLSKPEKAQTLDACVLIVPTKTFCRFDEATFGGWHCYDADYCVSVSKTGFGVYSLPGYVYHRSLDSTRNLSTQRGDQKKLYLKHRQTIHTTIGTVTWLSANFYPVWDFALKVYWKIFPTWVDWMKKDLKGCKSLLDIGCGYSSPIQYCDIPYKVGVEVFEPYLDESRKKAIHNEYIRSDIRGLNFGEGSFDAILASGVIEHLDSLDSSILLGRMSLWARKRVIITTPNGFISQDGYDNNLYQIHKSGWTVDELRARGYRVRGINGLKYLRGCRCQIKYKPAFLWERISDITQLFTRYCPKLAFQLYAVKEIK